MSVQSALLLGVLALLAGCGSGEEAVAARSRVLLVTLDTTRADRLHCYGNERIETPNLDRLAAEGVLFENSFTAVPSTLPSHCTILTGLLPARHGVHDNGVYALAAGLPTLAELFRSEGWRTAAFVSAFVLDAQFGLARGFEVYDDSMEDPLLDGDPARIQGLDDLSDDEKRWAIQQASPFQRDARSVTDAAIAWLDEHADESFFLWVHYFDPHIDYTPPAPWDARYDPDYTGEIDGTRKTWYLVGKREGWGAGGPPPQRELEHMIALYDGEISAMDAELGRLFGVLEARGIWDETLVVAVGDHGEGFGEHGQLFEHNGTIAENVMHVPLLVKPPGKESAGRRVSDIVRTVDVAPTVLEITGLSPLRESQGSSLLGLLEGRPGASSPGEALMQTLRGRQASPTPQSWLGLRSGRYKLSISCDADDEVIARFLFDIEKDPLERTPITEAHPDLVEGFSERIFSRWRELEARGEDDSFRGMSHMTSAALDALGYTDSNPGE